MFMDFSLLSPLEFFVDLKNVDGEEKIFTRTYKMDGVYRRHSSQRKVRHNTNDKITIILNRWILAFSKRNRFLCGRSRFYCEASSNLFLGFAFFMYLTIQEGVKGRQESLDAGEEIEVKYTMGMSIFVSIVGLAGIVLGGDLTVNAAKEIARAFGLSEALIGLTIVALGTSLPELVTSIVAAQKGESDIALGNVVGSNIFNIFLI